MKQHSTGLLAVKEYLFNFNAMQAKKNILITGASGTVGLAILEQLSASLNKYNITVFDQKSKIAQKRLKKYENSVKVVYGDISKIEAIEYACPEQDIVFHIAAVIPPVADDLPALAYRVNVSGTKNLIKGLETHSPNAFVIYSSSISVYGDHTHEPDITINSPLRPSVGDEYAKTKIEAEQIIQNSQLNWSIFRLTAVMGYGNHKVSKLMFHMPLPTQIEIVTPIDCATAFVNTIDKLSVIEKKIFNLGGGEHCRISYEEFLNRSFSIMGLGKGDFPKKAFADTNFHCGHYADGDALEEILKFRNDTIESYFKNLELTVPSLQKKLTQLFSGLIKKKLLKQSEPYHAYHNNDQVLRERFFGKN